MLEPIGRLRKGGRRLRSAEGQRVVAELASGRRPATEVTHVHELEVLREPARHPQQERVPAQPGEHREVVARGHGCGAGVRAAGGRSRNRYTPRSAAGRKPRRSYKARTGLCRSTWMETTLP